MSGPTWREIFTDLSDFPMEQSDWQDLRAHWKRLAGPTAAASVYSVADGGRGAGALEDLVKERLSRAREAFPRVVAEWEDRWHGDLAQAAPGRRRDWAAGRMALLRVFEELSETLRTGPEPRSEAHSLPFSLTHSGGQALALGSTWSEGLLGVGVDLETAGRMISPRLAVRLVADPEEAALVQATVTGAREPEEALGALDLWVLKEAAYKAQPASRGTTLPQYMLRAWSWERPGQWGLARLQGPRPEVRFEAALGRLQGWVVALAVARTGGIR
ncbi:MAG: 4'-phosphopantetheinyl transferase superfamily protein [Bdellovibrionales bacterium]|nr:4'-phosphopantetheinyl transferase superfamily protein [Bdellovibrionales bacterium]